MNEYQRQAYLSALGVENYAPRMRLSVAPEPRLCALPFLNVKILGDLDSSSKVNDKHNKLLPENMQEHAANPILIAEVLRDLEEQQNTVSSSSAIPVQPDNGPLAETVSPFALSVWRPCPGLLVIDSRNTQLALPTELLLRNILNAVFVAPMVPGREEILRWPMIEQAGILSTEEEARDGLQVWLDVELEQHPAEYVLLMGYNAARFFLTSKDDYKQKQWQWVAIALPKAQALIAPSLSEVLRQPMLKRELWKSLQPLRVDA